jgi:two-component system, NarL family, response regulator NreC
MTIQIVLADDHTIVREGLRLLLEMQPDMRVMGDVSNGRAAVQLVAHLRPDVALVDMAMPELNGIEATRQILDESPHTRVIILSMHGAAEYVVRALQAGARGYLLKDADGLTIIAAVRAVHAGQRYLSPAISETLVDQYLRQHVVADTLGSLTPREREIMQLVAEGKSSAEIAQILQLSPKTVETYRSRLMDKLGIDNLAGLVRYAIQHGVISLE